jgi:hypothetical protein
MRKKDSNIGKEKESKNEEETILGKASASRSDPPHQIALKFRPFNRLWIHIGYTFQPQHTGIYG